LYWHNYWYTYTLINLEQSDIKIINLIGRVSSYYPVKCSIRTRFMNNVGFVAYKLKRYDYRLENLNEASYKV